MMFLGLVMFVLVIVLVAPQSQAFLLGLASGAGTFLTAWAPFSYVLLLILLAAPCVGMYLVHTWPQRVDEENPMAKYRKEMPLDED
jgi:hypothetical protein